MSITSRATVEAEYVAKRDAILAYPPSSLDDDLAKLEVLASRVDECLAVLRAREALNGRPSLRPDIERMADAAAAVRGMPGNVRGYIAAVKADLAAVDNPPGP